MEGRTLAGRYRLVEPIGKGTSATVWRAQDVHMEIEVAVKVLHPQYSADPSRTGRFEREARALAALGDPAIVKVYDFGRENDAYFIVQEFIEGTTLAARLADEGPIEEEDCRLIGAATAHALAVSHSAGIVHRDIKPHNVLLGADGRVCVTDFGIARALSDAGLTQTGTVLGTARYISPEQATGGLADARSDIYALGTVLYEMGTGRPPFEGEEALAVAERHVNDEPVPLRKLRPELSQAYEAIVLKCLAKRPEDRYASAGELFAALEGGLAPEKLKARRRRLSASDIGAPPRWVPAAVLAVLLVLVGAVIGGALAKRPEVDAGFVVPKLPVVRQPPGYAVVRPLSVRDFDPEGDGQENPGEAANTIDNDAQSFWRTDRYNSETLGNLKSGVGLVYDFGRPAPLARATVVVVGEGVSLEIRGSNDAESWNTLARGELPTSRADFALSGAQYRYASVWLTRLGPDGESGEGYRGRVSEVSFARRAR